MSNSVHKFLLGAVLLAGCAQTNRSVCEAPGLVDDGTCSTSVLNIIASPEAYEGKVVSVLGFVDLVGNGKREAILLYPSREARAMQSTTVAVRVLGEGRQLELIRGRNRTDVAARATGLFSRANADQGVLGEIKVRP